MNIYDFLLFEFSLRGRSSCTRARLGIIQVLVGCEFQNFESDLNENKMIYLHLNRFFRAKWSISQYVLDKMALKYKKGDRVYVSGKVGNSIHATKWIDLEHKQWYNQAIITCIIM